MPRLNCPKCNKIRNTYKFNNHFYFVDICFLNFQLLNENEICYYAPINMSYRSFDLLNFLTELKEQNKEK